MVECNELIADLALRCGAAALISADACDPSGQACKVMLDPGRALEMSCDWAESDLDDALGSLCGRRARQRDAWQAGGNGCDIAEHLRDPVRGICDRELIGHRLGG